MPTAILTDILFILVSVCLTIIPKWLKRRKVSIFEAISCRTCVHSQSKLPCTKARPFEKDMAEIQQLLNVILHIHPASQMKLLDKVFRQLSDFCICKARNRPLPRREVYIDGMVSLWIKELCTEYDAISKDTKLWSISGERLFPMAGEFTQHENPDQECTEIYAFSAYKNELQERMNHSIIPNDNDEEVPADSTVSIYEVKSVSLQSLITSKLNSSEMSQGCVYMYKRPRTRHDRTSFDDLIKIGVSNNVDVRMATIGRQCGYRPQLIGEARSTPFAKRIEALVHAELSLKGLRRSVTGCPTGSCKTAHREFFEILPDEADYVIDFWVKWLEKNQPYNKDGSFKPDLHMRLLNYDSLCQIQTDIQSNQEDYPFLTDSAGRIWYDPIQIPSVTEGRSKESMNTHTHHKDTESGVLQASTGLFAWTQSKNLADVIIERRSNSTSMRIRPQQDSPSTPPALAPSTILDDMGSPPSIRIPRTPLDEDTTYTSPYSPVSPLELHERRGRTKEVARSRYPLPDSESSINLVPVEQISVVRYPDLAACA